MTSDALQLIDAAERMMIDNEQWNGQSMKRYKEWERAQDASVDIEAMDRSDRPGMYRLITSWCNASEFDEWATRTFSIGPAELPVFLLYTPKEDGFWKMDRTHSMTRFVEDVFDGKLDITFCRSWMARK